MTDLTNLTITQAVAALKKKEFSATELTKAHIKAMEAARPLNAFVTETPERALEDAKRSDAKLAKGEAGLLEGIPLGIKENFCTKGVMSTACSGILDGFVPTYESTVTANLFKEGAVMMGKMNMDDAAMGSSTTTSYYGHTENPWRKAGDNRPLVPGGSSGGSAAAVAARCVMGATGTDTGGSIRQPASFCGITGIKPTYGRCSRWGIIAFASSLDQAGALARTVKDSALLLQAMAGYDPKDSTSVKMDVPDFASALTGNVKGLKVGIPREVRSEKGVSEEIFKIWDQGIDWLKQAGAELVEVNLPNLKYALATYYIIAPAEASSNLARYDGVRYGLRVEGKTLDEMYENTRSQGFGKEVQRRILIGTYVLSAGYYDAYYTKAQKVRRLIADDYNKAYQKCDVILTPTTPDAAFPIGEKQDDPVAMYLCDIFTVPVNIAGLPGMSVPVGLNADGLPLGLQLVGRPFDEATILKVGDVLEQAANFKEQPQFLAKVA